MRKFLLHGFKFFIVQLIFLKPSTNALNLFGTQMASIELLLWSTQIFETWRDIMYRVKSFEEDVGKVVSYHYTLKMVGSVAWQC